MTRRDKTRSANLADRLSVTDSKRWTQAIEAAFTAHRDEMARELEAVIERVPLRGSAAIELQAIAAKWRAR